MRVNVDASQYRAGWGSTIGRWFLEVWKRPMALQTNGVALLPFFFFNISSSSIKEKKHYFFYKKKVVVCAYYYLLAIIFTFLLADPYNNK